MIFRENTVYIYNQRYPCVIVNNNYPTCKVLIVDNEYMIASRSISYDVLIDYITVYSGSKIDPEYKRDYNYLLLYFNNEKE